MRDYINKDLDEEFKNIKENDKVAKEKIKNYCKHNGNKLDYKMQLDLIELVSNENKRKVNLPRLLKELNIGFSYSHVKDEKGFKYIIIRV